MIQILTSNQNPSCYNELEDLKQQTRACYKRMISFAGVDANIVIVIVTVLDVNGPLSLIVGKINTKT